MCKVAKGALVLWSFAISMACGARASDADIASFNTLQTAAPATIEKVEVLNPSFAYRHVVIQSYGGLYEPRISFTVVNKSPVTISKVYLTGVLKERGRVAPLAAQDFSFSIPGGLQPGERKHFDLEATSYGDWSAVTQPESRSAVFLVTLNAIDDARGERLVR
ncbi:MAG: hypothetical protein WAK01_20255 [Methylocystis sp.]